MPPRHMFTALILIALARSWWIDATTQRRVPRAA